MPRFANNNPEARVRERKAWKKSDATNVVAAASSPIVEKKVEPEPELVVEPTSDTIVPTETVDMVEDGVDVADNVDDDDAADGVEDPSDDEEADTNDAVGNVIEDYVKSFHDGFEIMNRATLHVLIDVVREQCNVELDMDELIAKLNEKLAFESTLVLEDSVQKKKKEEIAAKKKVAKPGEKNCAKIMGPTAANAGGPCGKTRGRNGDANFCTACLKQAWARTPAGYDAMVQQCIKAGYIDADDEAEEKPKTKAKGPVRTKTANSKSGSSSESESKKKPLPTSKGAAIPNARKVLSIKTRK